MPTSHRTDIQVRFGDTDALGHLNNASYAQFAELGRLDFLGTLGVRIGMIILARLAIDFRRPVQFEDEVWIETHVGSIGTSSFVLQQTVFANAEPAAEMSSVTVTYDFEAGRKREIPEDLRLALEPFLVT